MSLRDALSGWTFTIPFLMAPVVILVIYPDEFWMRALFLAPWFGMYAWLAWPRNP